LTYIRRFFLHGFSEKALRDQEPIMNKYFNLFIQRLHENCAEAVDINKWFDLLGFDVIGDLTFGESFGGLEKSKFHVSLSVPSNPRSNSSLALDRDNASIHASDTCH
jgi:hypothetical protein